MAKKIPLAPRGVLAPVSAHAGQFAQPPLGTSGIFPAYVSAELPSNISLNPSEVISKDSELYDKSFRIRQFSGQNRVNWGGKGVSEFSFILIFLFMLLESPLKNSGPYDKSSWDILEIRPFSGQNRVN